MALNNKAIETLSVNAVRDSIMMTDLLDQYIPDNDKEPFWDGAVYIYNEISHKKDTFIGRMPVQVKGTENDDFSKNEISFKVSVTDLDGYLKDGGVIYFVVYIGNGGLRKKIYYVELTPIRIRIILGEAKKQKSKYISLKEFPYDNDAKTTIFMNCLQNCKKQASFYNAKLYSLDELKEQGVLEKITVSLSGVGFDSDPQKALVQSDVYFYANTKGNPIPQPLPFIPQNLQTKQDINTSILIDGKTFYDSIHIVKKANSTEYILGDSFIITSFDGKEGVNIKYTSSDMVSTLAKDLDFMLSWIDSGYFESNGHRFDYPSADADYSNFNLEEEHEKLSFAKKASRVLSVLNCEKDLSLRGLTDEDYRNMERLYSCLIENKPVTGFKKDLPPVCKIKIGDLNFIIFLIAEQDNTYLIKNFFNCDVLVTYKCEDDEEYPVSHLCLLKADDLLYADNIDWRALLSSFQMIERNKITIANANAFLLELLIAYDKSSKKIILDVAKDFSDWIMTSSEDELPYNVKILNELQIIKRMRDFNFEETKTLCQIVLDENAGDEILTGAYLLLGEQTNAEKHYNNLSPDKKDEFNKYPIYHFWKNAEETNNG